MFNPAIIHTAALISSNPSFALCTHASAVETRYETAIARSIFLHKQQGISPCWTEAKSYEWTEAEALEVARDRAWSRRMEREYLEEMRRAG